MKKNGLVAAILGGIAAVVYFASMATFAFPGESAHLQALWRGLDFATVEPYPFMAVFAKLFGAGNLLAPVCGVLAVVLLFLLVDFFVRERITGEHTQQHAGGIALVAAAVSALVFMLTPAVRVSATHLEPRLFDATWALLMFATVIPLRKFPASGVLCSILMGVMAALGFCDSALFILLMPGALAAIVTVRLAHGKKPYLALSLFVFSFLAAFVLLWNWFGFDLSEFLKNAAKEMRACISVSGWLFVAIFTVLPFVTVLFSSGKAYNEKPGPVQWLFHLAMSFVAIIAVATPLSPSSLLAPLGILPVVTSAYAAFVAGHLVSYWWVHRKLVIGKVAGGILTFVLAVTCVWNLFTFDGSHGSFADEVARKVIADLGDRTWLVTDGTLDDHFLLAAAASGKELNLIQLSRDLDTAYLDRLGKIVRDKNVGGSKNDSLVLSLSLGVLPFVQDWFAADPSVAKEVAIYGAPDLWYAANLKPVPEFMFFGADPKRVPDWNADWKAFDAVLEAPKGWGSYRLYEVKDPVDRLRFSIRRHLGMVANNRGVYLQDEKRDDEAFEMYERVLNSIDADNVCSLFNEIEMAGAKHPKAQAKRRELERQLKTIVDDKSRRYVIWRLGYYYGYIRNPDMFIRLGFAWARSGRPGDALSQIKRAIDFVPTDKRSVLLNMMAALYANESDHQKSRQIYEALLRKNEKDHDALIGMMRLSLMDGDSKQAMTYLERASENAGTGKRAQVEQAMLAMMRNDQNAARTILKKLTDADHKDLQAWSLLAAVTMQLCDAAKDDKTRKALEKELSVTILPAMERESNNPYDYYVQTTKAFLLLRQGAEKRREARDAFVAASKARPDVQTTQDLVLGLDITLDDKKEAERHAREVLRRNRNAPLANYVMGSIALGKGENREAEAFLRKAVNVKKPNAMALNDLAEVLRRNKNYAEAERYARETVKVAPRLYVAWETLGVIIAENKGDLDEAEKCVTKACDLSKNDKGKAEDVRMLISLARIQLLKGDKGKAKTSIRKVQSRVSELDEFSTKEFEELKKSVR